MPAALLAIVALAAPAQSAEPTSPVGLEPATEGARWTVEVGRGFSRPVVDGEDLYVVGRDEDARLLRLDAASGRERWRATFEDERREGQEGMGGDAPHAAPLVHRGVVLALGFGGVLRAFDAATGEARWSLDLVDELGAEPVQFGFAASPIALDDLAVVPVGAPAPGYVALDPRSGEVRWRSKPYPASYVTPVLAQLDGDRQLVCVTNDATLGLDPESGEELWALSHVATGQTNFAPLRVGADGDVYVSGQGSRGLRRVDVERAGEGWVAREAWLCRRAQLEHGQAVASAGRIYGSCGAQLACVEEATGELAFRVRGFEQCTLVPYRGRTAILGERGVLTVADLAPDRIEVYARVELGGERAWTAPLVLGDSLLVRANGVLSALDIELPAEPIERLETGGPPPPDVRPTGVVVEWTESQRARVVGGWTLNGAIGLSFTDEDGGLVATSDAHPGVHFRVDPESATRAWLYATDAPYGIPPIRLEVEETEAPQELRIFAGGDVLVGRRGEEQG